MIIDTAKVVVVSLVLLFIIGTIGIIFIKPSNTVTYYVMGQMLAPIQEHAREVALELNESNLTRSATIIDTINQNDETYNKLWEGSQNSEKAWMLYGFLGFIVVILFYTGWTEVNK